MATFIKLTVNAETDELASVNIDRIACVQHYARTSFPQWRGMVAFSGLEGDYLPVLETREEILALIAAASQQEKP